jgi:hypothetical protein
MLYMVSEAYKQRLANWVEGEKNKHGSYGNLATAITIAAGKGITKDTLRLWHRQNFVRDLSIDMLEMIAAYKSQTVDDVRAWLELGESGSADTSPVTHEQIARVSDPLELVRIQMWAAERLKELLSRPETRTPPSTFSEFTRILLSDTEAVAARAEMPPDRVRAIGRGAEPTAKEMGMLSRYWDSKADWVKKLYTQSKTQSPPQSKTLPGNKTPQTAPPDSKAAAASDPEPPK